jgi:ABC-type glycerol-3-phosphate transport system permease component
VSVSSIPSAFAPRSGGRRRRRSQGLRLGVLCALALGANIPVLVVIVNSLKSTAEFLSTNSLFPIHWTVENYGILGTQTDFASFVRTSVTVTALVTTFSVAVAMLAGYSLSRTWNTFAVGYARSVLMLQMFPIILELIPLFILFRYLHLINTSLSVVPLYVAGVLPYGIWMAKGFFDGIPRELEEAAWVDGSSRFAGFWRIVLPLSGPGLAAIAIFSFLLSWNEFLVASVFLRNPHAETIPVGVFVFVQEYQTNWGPLFAASALALIPAFIFVTFAQRYMVQGAVVGSVKG